MNRHRSPRLSLLATFALASALLAAPAAPVAPVHAAPAVELKKGDHVCLLGGSLGQRLQHHNYFETLLHQRFPQHELVVRNLCFDADEVTRPQYWKGGNEPLQPRSAGFGDLDSHLKHSKADVLLLFFGFNESFNGAEGLAKFKTDLEKFIADRKKQNYSGNGSPRIVLVSPIAAEDIGDPNLPDARALNRQLKPYVDAMRQVAGKTQVGFADVFTPTLKAFAGDDHFTFNGVHMSEEGYKKFAPVLDRALFGDANAPGNFNAALKVQIDDKNFHWFMRYRALDGYYIYGGRSKLSFEPDKSLSNNKVCEHERAILDVMTANRDKRIWAVAQGKSVPAKVDDSNTPKFIEVETNYGGKQRKQGKEGSIDYLSAAQQTKQFKMGEGYAVNCFASEEDFPELANPVQMTFDAKGRLWVTVMPSYPHWKPKDKLNDKILILEDTDGDGKADKKTVFADGLHVPTGIELGDGGAYVAQMPYLVHLKDTNGDDKADVMTRVLGGFDSADTHHQASAFVWGPGGGLYFQEGTFFFSQVETPHGPTRMFNAGVWRYEPTRQQLDAFVSYGFANPWGHIFDRWGQNFVADASGGANYYGTAFSGRVIHPDKHKGMKQWIKKRFRPTCGSEIIASRHFPSEAQGNFLLNNTIGALGVYQHTVHDEGSGFVAREIEPIAICEDRNFRPVDLQFGPDGALYVCDWHNALIGHMQHHIRDPSRDETHGRIWRITYPSRPLVKVIDLTKLSAEQLLDRLKDPEDRVRNRARVQLREHDTKQVLAAIEKWKASLDKNDKNHGHHLLEALWVQQHHNAVDLSFLKQMLRHDDERIRAAATRVLCYTRHRLSLPDALALLKTQVNDKHPRVRLEAVRALSFFDTAKAAEIALEATQHEMDDYLNYTLGETLKTLRHFQ